MQYKLSEFISDLWQLLLAVLDYAIWKHPFTFMLVPWFIHDANGIMRYPSSLMFVAVSCILDSMLLLIAVDINEYRFYRKLKKDRSLGLIDHPSLLESSVVDRLLDVTKAGLKAVLALTRLPINDNIKVVFCEKRGATARTYSSITFASIVAMRQRLNNIDDDDDEDDEDEDMDEEKKKKKEKEKEKKMYGYYILAHELGHVLHSLSAFYFSIIPVVTVAFELLLVCHVSFNLKSSDVGIIVMMCLFNLNAVILMLYDNYLINNSERQADFAGISIIKYAFGTKKMGKAARYYLTQRIVNTRNTKNKKQFELNSAERKRQLDCIKTLAPFVSRKDKKELLDIVYSSSRDIERTFEKEAKENLIMASRKWSIDKQIQEALKGTNGDESASYASEEDEILNAYKPAPYPSEMLKEAKTLRMYYRLGAVGTIVFISATLDNYTYSWGYQPFLIALVLFIVFYGINYLFIRMLCNKTEQLKEQIGI